MKPFSKKNPLSESATVNKTFFLAGDFNINLFDFETNKKVESFVNFMFEFSMIPTINKTTRVTKHTATAINNIITNCIINRDFKSAIVKTDLSDHFPIIFINELTRVPTPTDDMEKYVTSKILLKTHLIALNRHYLKHLGIVLKT